MAQLDFTLPQRMGDKPQTNSSMPQLQLTQNASEELYQRLAEWLFSLEHIEERKTHVSIPSSRAAWISDSYLHVNPIADREFVHIHTEPGPGSLHLHLPKEDADEVLDKGWGKDHPRNSYQPNFEILMIYAPRDDDELEVVKKIITRAYQWSLATELRSDG